MAWRIPSSQTTQVTLLDGQDVLVGDHVAITVEGGHGIRGDFSGHHARIYGMVASEFATIQLGLDGSGHSGEIVEIYSGAQVHHVGTNYAVSFLAFGSTLNNDGLITSTFLGISLGGINPDATSTVTNSGTIDSVGNAIVRNGTETISVLNSGTIESDYNAFDGTNASGLDLITNTGTMIGDVYLGGGDDLYDGRLGAIQGDVFGGAGIDRLYSDAGNNRLFGEGDNDTLMGGAGADYLSGGTGTDRAAYSSATKAVIVSLSNPSINSGDAAGDTYNSIENLTGSNYNDALNGNSAKNAINGGAGNDTIKGYAGNDTLTGYSGADSFVFNTALNASTNVDTIADFSVTADTIQLDDAVFAALTAGTLASAAFRANTTGLAGDASDRIIYETDTGELYYDANGNASGGGVLFAKVGVGLSLTNGDFVVI